MQETFVYGIIALVGIILAAFASWKIIYKPKSIKVSAKNGSIASGRDVNIHSKNEEK